MPPTTTPAGFLRLDLASGTARFPLREGRLLVGRAPECDIVIEDDSVSRKHATLAVEGGAVEVEDHGSRNGTMVNGQPVQRARLTAGDTVVFGVVTAAVEPGEAQDPLERTVFRRPAAFSTIAQLPTAVSAAQLIGLLGEIARTLVAATSLEETLGKVLDLLFGHVRAERGAILMREEGGELVPVLARWSDGREAKPVVSRTVLDMALDQQMAIVTTDVLADARFDAAMSLRRAEARSVMCVPLYAQGETVGALYVDNTTARLFSEADLELVTALANYAAVAIARVRLADQAAEDRQQRERLQRYHSPAVVERIVSRDTRQGGLEAQEIDVSVLFADIVQFTTLAEAMTPTEVAAMLNAFLSRMVEAVFAEHGTVDKFLGDAVLAVFGAPVGRTDHAARAVRTAQAMRRAVRHLNDEGRFPQLRVRYAINSGVAIAGDIGSDERKEYTVLGDVVNVAARLQSVAEPDQLVVSRATVDRMQLSVAVTPLGEVPMRGRVGTVEVLAVHE
jgi:adenylate cyclase